MQSNEETSNIDNYEVIKTIGKGSHGEVYLVKSKIDEQRYVLKKIHMRETTDAYREATFKEVKLLASLKHPNIVSYKESFVVDSDTPAESLCIVMEYCSGGDLYARLQKQKQSSKQLPEKQVMEWFCQIVWALQYIHRNNVLHRDLKTQNIFLDANEVIKLGDFGIARTLEGAREMASTMVGTPFYMSPEIFEGRKYNFKSDIWALGCCLFEITTQRQAFDAKEMPALVLKVLKGHVPAIPSNFSPQLSELIRSLLNKSAHLRPSCAAILKLPFIKKAIESSPSLKSLDSVRPKPSRPTMADIGTVGSPSKREVIEKELQREEEKRSKLEGKLRDSGARKSSIGTVQRRDSRGGASAAHVPGKKVSPPTGGSKASVSKRIPETPTENQGNNSNITTPVSSSKGKSENRIKLRQNAAANRHFQRLQDLKSPRVGDSNNPSSIGTESLDDGSIIDDLDSGGEEEESNNENIIAFTPRNNLARTNSDQQRENKENITTTPVNSNKQQQQQQNANNRLLLSPRASTRQQPSGTTKNSTHSAKQKEEFPIVANDNITPVQKKRQSIYEQRLQRSTQKIELLRQSLNILEKNEDAPINTDEIISSDSDDDEEEEEVDSDEESDGEDTEESTSNSVDDRLDNAALHRGSLSQRIRLINSHCSEKLGDNVFQQVKKLVKQSVSAEDESLQVVLNQEMAKLLGSHDQVTYFSPLIAQLIFCEESMM